MADQAGGATAGGERSEIGGDQGRVRMTRAQQAGLRVEDVPRPSLAKRRCRYKLDAQVRQALGLVVRRRGRPKKAER